MNPIGIISKYYEPDSKAYNLLVTHSRQVADKALAIAANLPDHNLDMGFLKEASMLHDIGIFLTDAPGLGCNGRHPYLLHGLLGRRLLEKEDLPRHALVCERHVGVGISKKDVLNRGLPLPPRDMLPLSLDEKIICYADKFYSKNGTMPPREKSLDDVVDGIQNYGSDQVDRFLNWHGMFS
ncbi:MAG: HD domain-containing protein [Deltaproteobacteria bacterium]|nr:HD domain-containing protein [Deltaproteobacteria bacterium]MBW2676441.1 HD domain-containing protein [Deltaproteobacteria bacterium]